jgi:outer membrane protein insertion porin family
MLKLIAISVLGFALAAPWPTKVIAQNTPHFTMQQIVFKGTRALTNEQLLRALAMKVGGSYTQQDLVDAANKLANSGMFAQVSYRFSTTSAEFDLVDKPHLVPLRFENCVWATDEQMIGQLKKRVPLFIGEVPEEGTIVDEIGTQVEAVLAENGVKAKVQYMPFMENGSVTAMNYTILDPRIEVSAIRFVGASPKLAQALDDASKGILGKEYTRALLPSTEDPILKRVLEENGYLHGRFGDSSLSLAGAPGDSIVKVELTVPVEEGAQYRIASLAVKGDDPVALEAAKRLAQFKTGDVANMTTLRAELARLGGAYLVSGHMNAKVRAEPTYDETAHTVSFEIELVPGEVYKLSKLDLQGLDDAQKAKLLAIWRLNPGDVYDPTYAPSFLRKNQAKLGFLNGYSLAWTQKIYDDNRTVELFVFFRRPGSGVQ